MNIVFWLIILVAMVAVWFCLSFVFKGIGGIGIKMWKHTEKEMFDNDDKQEDKENDK